MSPWVALTLQREGVDVCGVRDRGLLEASDPEVFRRAFAEDRVVVTGNVADFELLARTCELHAGVVLLEQGNLFRHEQLAIVRLVVAAIEARPDMIDTVLRVAEDGTLTFETLPATSWPGVVAARRAAGAQFISARTASFSRTSSTKSSGGTNS